MKERIKGFDAITEYDLTYRQRGDLKHATVHMLEKRVTSGDLFVTFAWNRSRQSRKWGNRDPRRYPNMWNSSTKLTVLSAHRQLDEFVKRIDRYSLGPRYHKKSVERRCVLVAMPEHFESNLHFHGIFRPGEFPDGTGLYHYVAECRQIWERLVPGGSLDIQEVGEIKRKLRKDAAVAEIATTGMKKVIGYVTKQLAAPGGYVGAFFAGSW